MPMKSEQEIREAMAICLGQLQAGAAKVQGVNIMTGSFYAALGWVLGENEGQFGVPVRAFEKLLADLKRANAPERN